MIYLAVYDNLNIQQTLLISLVCMLIVFGMLAILWGIVSLFKILPQKEEKEEVKKASNKQTINQTEKIKMEDIKDDDMMVAAIVASIDYHNEIKKDVRVVSVKEL